MDTSLRHSESAGYLLSATSKIDRVFNKAGQAKYIT